MTAVDADVQVNFTMGALGSEPDFHRFFADEFLAFPTMKHS